MADHSSIHRVGGHVGWGLWAGVGDLMDVKEMHRRSLNIRSPILPVLDLWSWV